MRIDYQYDALGRRVVDGRTASLYDGLGMNPLHEWQLNEGGYERSFAETDGANAVRFRSLGEDGNSGDDVCGFDRTYIYANGRLLGQRNRNYAYSLGIEDSRYGYMQDMRNSIGTVTDGKGNKISGVSYDLNGKMYSYDRRRQAQENAASLGLDHGFVGKKYDAMTASYNFGYRDYSPTTASFTSEDPIRDGLNWYSYCAGDPVNFVDLWGLEEKKSQRKKSIVVVEVGASKAQMDFLKQYDYAVQPIFIKPESSDVSHKTTILKFIQDIVLISPIYQPGAGGNFGCGGSDSTWCNQSSFDVNDSTGVNAKYIYGKLNRYNVNAVTATKNLINASEKLETSIFEIDGGTAQLLANNGYTVTAALDGSNHLSTVRPSSVVYNVDEGPCIANVGASNGEMKTYQGFGKKAWNNGKVRFFVDVNQSFEYDFNIAKDFTNGNQFTKQNCSSN